MLKSIFRAWPIALVILASALHAQDDPAAELDSLAQQSVTGAGGMNLARTQADSGDLLGALATIDRVLMIDPKVRPALLMRAALLCRVDDRQGGTAQLARLKQRDFSRADWAQARAACAAASAAAPSPSPSAAPSEAAPRKRNTRWPPPGF